jgi:hypothetical protein
MCKFPSTLLLFITIIFLPSCKTYYISVESFKEQFAGLEPTKEVITRGPGGDKATYMTYPIDSIKCVEKNGAAYILLASPSLEMRFTYGDKNKQTIFYFDLIRLNDTLLTGGQSRFIPSIKKSISLNSITKIEIQDGHKKFSYVN